MASSTELKLIHRRQFWIPRLRAGGFLDDVLFIVATVLSLLLAVVVLRKGIGHWVDPLYMLAFYLVLAYLALPRIHHMLTMLYVPGYFIGRSRTGDGLLGDPVNLALVGEADQIHEVMEQAGWTEADPVSLASALRIVSSSLLHRSYAHAPVSPLFLFGRQQDFAYQQEVAGNPSQRHHVRFWHCPPDWPLPGGRRVEWLAAGTYDKSVGLSLFTLQVTHKVAADIDMERDHIISTMKDSSADISVDVIENFSTGYHARNGGGDAVHTDGNLPVIDVSGVDVPWSGQRPAPMPVLEDVGRRPLPVALACLIVAVSTAAQICAALITMSQDFSEMVVTSGNSRTTVIVLITVVLTLWALATAGLTWLVFQGKNTARLILLVMMTVSLVIGLWNALFSNMPGVLLLLRLIGDVLVVYALTSVSARDWTMHRVSNRKAARHRNRGQLSNS
ncbi:LssY C-terminal domain-containing protein [Propionibacterium sp.]|uniref:LssY C-terminal domain-containing protein n=1 Tax=Propionibacterium sp. TaxID=1977903 RepID=UPI0039ED5450